MRETTRKFRQSFHRLRAADREIIRRYYEATADSDFDLSALANQLGFTRTTICKEARKMGLTNQGRGVSDAARSVMSAARSERWSDPHPNGVGGNSRGGVRDDVGPMHFRSSWEANVARYLAWLQARGEITRWEYEPQTFWFNAIKRGVRSYLPDFRITAGDRVYYLEVKGYMDAKSKTKIRRMAKYYPKVELRILDRRQYQSLKRSLGRIIPHWE